MSAAVQRLACAALLCPLLVFGIRIDGDAALAELGKQVVADKPAEKPVLLSLRQAEATEAGADAVFRVTHEEIEASRQQASDELRMDLGDGEGESSDWFWRSGCKFRFRDRKTEQFFFQVCDGTCIAARLTRDAKDPVLEIWEDRDWYAKLVPGAGHQDDVEFTAVPKDANNTRPMRSVKLFSEVNLIEYQVTSNEQILRFKEEGTDMVFVDGLYLEPHIIALSLKDGTVSDPTAATQWWSGRAFDDVFTTTRWKNYTGAGAALGLKTGSIVSPAGGVAAVAMMAVGVGPAVLGTLVGVAGFTLGGYSLGGLAAGVGGLLQRLGITNDRHVTEKLGAEQKIFQELRCMRGFSVCKDKQPEPPTEEEARNPFAPQKGPTQRIVRKGTTCPA